MSLKCSTMSAPMPATLFLPTVSLVRNKLAIGLVWILVVVSGTSTASGQTYSYDILMDTDVNLHGKDLTWLGLLSVNDSDTVATSVEFAGMAGTESGVFSPIEALIKTGDVVDGQTVGNVANGGGGYGINNSSQVATSAHMDPGTGVRASIVKAGPNPTQNRIVAQHGGPAVCGLTLAYSMSHPRNSNIDAVLFQSGFDTMGSGPSQANFKVRASDSACLDHVKLGDTVGGPGDEQIVTGFESGLTINAGGFAINDDGDWIMLVTYNGGHGLVFADAQAGHAKTFVQKTGDVVAGRTIDYFVQSPFLGDNGEILYIAAFVGGGQGLISVGGPAPRGLLAETGDVVGCREIDSFVKGTSNTAGDTVFLAKLVGGPSEYGAFTLTSRIVATGDVVAGAMVEMVDDVTIGETGNAAMALTYPASRKAIVLASPIGPAVGCCGNGQPDLDEECDDGNANNNDACTNSCMNATCGDGIIGPGETCDDEGDSGADGCSAICMMESGWTCSGEPSVCTPECGDGLVIGGETCDDGNVNSGDGCSSLCQCEGTCGDGAVNPVEACGEQCDLGGQNGQPESACSSFCQAEGICTVSQEACVDASDCPPSEGCCGNGTIDADEACDDGNPQDGDCCSSTCAIESNTLCSLPCQGVSGPHLLSPVSMRLRFTDKDVNGFYENWTTKPRGTAGLMILRTGQAVDPRTERTRISFSQNDPSNPGERRILGEFTVEPSDWTRCSERPAGSGDETCTLRDPSEMASSPPGVKSALIKEKGVELRYKFKGVKEAAIEVPDLSQSNKLRVCIHIGDDAGTALLSCEERGPRLLCDTE